MTLQSVEQGTKPMRFLGAMMGLRVVCATATTVVIFLAQPAHAQERLKLAVGQRGNWASSVAEIGQRAGVFKKHGLELELLYTQGSGETQQAVIAGSVDIGIAAGTMGAMSAFAKGAPVRILGAETTGASDIYWYVKADSPIKSLQDFDGKTVAYSTNGSSTHMVVSAFMQERGLKLQPIATGGPVPTLTLVMSGQVDVGWGAPPDGLDQLDRGEIRIVANGNDAVMFREQTVRVNVVNVQTLTTRRDVVERFGRAYRESARWLYSGDAPLKLYAEWLGFSLAKAARTRDGFYPWEAVDPDRIAGLDAIVQDAVRLKYLSAPLSRAQLDDLVVKSPP